MTEIEMRTLKNQIEIMWTLHYLLSKVAPDLVGLSGELDSYREDLCNASKETKVLIERK